MLGPDQLILSPGVGFQGGKADAGGHRGWHRLPHRGAVDSRSTGPAEGRPASSTSRLPAP